MLRILLFAFLAVPCWCRLDEDNIDPPASCAINQPCFHQPATQCPSAGSCRCHKLPNCEKFAVCCDIENSFMLTEALACAKISPDGRYPPGNTTNVEFLHIRNATLENFNLTNPTWRRLRHMSITDGRIDNVIGEFAKHSTVSCLNLSSNGLIKIGIGERPLSNLFNLSVMDLSNNNLREVPNLPKNGNITLDVSNNQNMTCSNLSNTLKKPDVHFKNQNSTFCKSHQINFDWFNTFESVPLVQLIQVQKVQKECFKNCSCTPSRLQILQGKEPEYTFAVTCFGGFKSLPVPLPENTAILNISNNNITSLRELSHPSYQILTELYADNNQISSIQPLEGNKFLTRFVVLSLRNNKIKTLETYLLSNIKFDRNYNHRYLKLGLNNLHCDCNTAKDLKEWLMTKQSHIPDYNEIRCDNMELSVVNLDKSKLCQSQQHWTDYISFIITAEVLLLIGLIAKVFYDYWVFKTSGYLPWPASKMPKLPCDWLCE